MIPEERRHDHLFRPSHTVAHGADHHVLVDSHRNVTREEEVREWRQRVAGFVQQASERACTFLPALDQRANEIPRLHLIELAG